ncbi:MAG: ribosome-binding factor A [Chloroflexi bacterium]|nr:ribosome-binding factor A [Chloroflexota bacterium]|tara:strand:- start:2936 stop:3289 length:354 start_codon:yes stop_codon:yes gene_type:complete
MTNRRLEKVNVNIQRILGTLINMKNQGEVLSPIVSVTEVKISPDFAIAKIFVSIMGDENSVKLCLDSLKNNSKVFRKELSENIYLKKVPKLIFLLDDTLDKVEKMNKLFENLEIPQK